MGGPLAIHFLEFSQCIDGPGNRTTKLGSVRVAEECCKPSSLQSILIEEKLDILKKLRDMAGNHLLLMFGCA